MPITLGCPSCTKRFKARDESAGKKVKCPYCQVAVQVPAPDGVGAVPSGSGTLSDPLPAAAPGPSPVPKPVPEPVPDPVPKRGPSAPVVASPDEWGAVPTAPAPAAASAPAVPELQIDHEPFPLLPPAGAAARGGKDRPKPSPLGKDDKSDRAGKGDKAAKGKAKEVKPEQVAAAGWRSVRRGLFWVQFGLVWLSLVGFVGFGKAVYARAVGELPSGDGTSWVSIEGYVNAGGNAVKVSKTELLNLGLYGLPVFLAAMCAVLGRLIAGGAPRNSGARTLFGLSGLFGLIGVVGLFGSYAFHHLLMKDEEKYTWLAFLLLVPLAEFWFLTALTASGLALKRPKAARAVGALGFAFALAAFVPVLGWDLYVEYGRPKKPDDDVRMYEQAALLLGWLILVGSYWRAVRHVRLAAREYLDTVKDT